MSDESIPQNLGDHLYRKLAGLHANAHLIFVLDPAGRLALTGEITVGGRTWPVHRYEGNDLSFARGSGVCRLDRFTTGEACPDMGDRATGL